MGLSSAVSDALLVPDYFDEKKQPRYYQRIAIERAVRAVVGGQKRCLLTLATGTTTVAFQVCWKLWAAKWNAPADPTHKPRIYSWPNCPRLGRMYTISTATAL